ncbi:hypothetical protein [Leisingera sp. F5]|uniref:hypothetical protein n=1 Tax=Leisingera sp. F5 TaxID=1813816 RepID=UPI0025BEC707|nr:hypothetical protein [Leisingera sp. F5]
MKPTPKQQQALQHIKDGQVQYHRFGYGAWRITGPSQPTVVGRVMSDGLAKWEKAPKTDDAKIAVLTPKGVEALPANAHCTPPAAACR